jgi:hypothetical protein
VVAYVATLLITLGTCWRISRRPTAGGADDLALWATVLLAYGIGVLALTFSYPVFQSQTGLEFWLLNAVLFAAARPGRSRGAP